jgi:hypothetical protein
MPHRTLVAEGTGAFGNRWWLYALGSIGIVTRERSVGGKLREQSFDSLEEAREYFTTYTTPIVAIEA